MTDDNPFACFTCEKCRQLKTIEMSLKFVSPGGITLCALCYKEMIDAQFKAWIEEGQK